MVIDELFKQVSDKVSRKPSYNRDKTRDLPRTVKLSNKRTYLSGSLS